MYFQFFDGHKLGYIRRAKYVHVRIHKIGREERTLDQTSFKKALAAIPLCSSKSKLIKTIFLV